MHITRVESDHNSIELAGYILEYRGDNRLWIMRETDGVRSVVGLWCLDQRQSAPDPKGVV